MVLISGTASVAGPNLFEHMSEKQIHKKTKLPDAKTNVQLKVNSVISRGAHFERRLG
jgi:hypothetical protein